jgi:hypothetical protein
MKIIRNFVLIALLALTGAYAPAPAAAQNPAPTFTPRPQAAAAPVSPEALLAARELVSLISPSAMADLVSNISAQAWPPIEAALRARRPNIDATTMADLRGEFDHLTSSMAAEIMSNAPAIYARYFTAEEMRSLAAFYNTPAGAKTLVVMPAIAAEFNSNTMRDSATLRQQMRESFNNILREHGYAQ